MDLCSWCLTWSAAFKMSFLWTPVWPVVCRATDWRHRQCLTVTVCVYHGCMALCISVTSVWKLIRWVILQSLLLSLQDVEPESGLREHGGESYHSIKTDLRVSDSGEYQREWDECTAAQECEIMCAIIFPHSPWNINSGLIRRTVAEGGGHE